MRMNRKKRAMTRRSGWTLVETLIVLVLVIVGMMLAIPPMLKAQRSDAVAAALRGFDAVRHAEENFRTNDLDGNGQLDYWCRDIRGLASFKLVHERLAAADDSYADVLEYHGHVFQMLSTDEEGRPLADGSGTGPRLLYVMYPASEGFLRETWIHTENGPYACGERNPIRRMPRCLPALGWHRAG